MVSSSILLVGSSLLLVGSSNAPCSPFLDMFDKIDGAHERFAKFIARQLYQLAILSLLSQNYFILVRLTLNIVWSTLVWWSYLNFVAELLIWSGYLQPQPPSWLVCLSPWSGCLFPWWSYLSLSLMGSSLLSAKFLQSTDFRRFAVLEV
jgi:hypothetical protein